MCPGLVSCWQESAQLRDRLSQLQLEVAENKGLLSELNLEVQQKTDRLAEVELRLKDCLAEKAQEEERLSRRLRDSHETIASLRAQAPPIKVSVGASGLVQSLCRPGRGLSTRPLAPGAGLAQRSQCEWSRAAFLVCTRSGRFPFAVWGQARGRHLGCPPCARHRCHALLDSALVFALLVRSVPRPGPHTGSWWAH